MYVSNKDVDTIFEAVALVEGQVESVEDTEYWLDFFVKDGKFS